MQVDGCDSVLIVDDHGTTLRILRRVLEQLGVHDIEEARDGTQALDRLRTRRFDLIISDWHMEPMDGLELLRLVRDDPAYRRLPFIMITAESNEAQIALAGRSGLLGYIVKPFDAETLKRTIRAGFSHLSGPA